MGTNDIIAAYAARIQGKLDRKSHREGECLLWTGTVFNTGYGMIRIDYKMHGVHRVAYQLARGPIPAGHDIHHICRNRTCINPEHLEALSRRAHNHKTHRDGVECCARGHYFSEENTYWAPNGTRHCKVCRKLRDAPTRKGRPTHCPQGHAYDEANTYVFTDSRGRSQRQCRICRREGNRARQRARAKSRGGPGYRPLV